MYKYKSGNINECVTLEEIPNIPKVLNADMLMIHHVKLHVKHVSIQIVQNV